MNWTVGSGGSALFANLPPTVENLSGVILILTLARGRIGGGVEEDWSTRGVLEVAERRIGGRCVDRCSMAFSVDVHNLK